MGNSASETKRLWIVALVSDRGAVVEAGEWFFLQGVPADPAPVNVALHSRHEDLGLSDPVPRELVTEVTVTAPDIDSALAIAGPVANSMAVILSLAINAAISVPEPYLAFRAEEGAVRREFWQRQVPLPEGLPPPARTIDREWLGRYLEACFTSAEYPRLTRAITQYQLGLMYWTTRGRPLALAHLYMAMEALGPVVERSERSRLGLVDQRAHAVHRGVDVSRTNWREVLLGWVRRDVICKGDKATYDAARGASDGLEHGSLDLATYRAVAVTNVRAVLDYVREAIFDVLDLEADVRDTLLKKRALDVSPLWVEVRGELHGEVTNPRTLGEGNDPYPRLEWSTTMDDYKRLEDGRAQLRPRYHLKLHCAADVQFDLKGHAFGVGASDPDLFDYEPPDSHAPQGETASLTLDAGQEVEGSGEATAEPPLT